MRNSFSLLLLMLAVLMAGACSRDDGSTDTASQASGETEESVAMVEEESTGNANEGELPLNTDSEAASEVYVQGEYLMDVGRNVQARAKFLEAIDADPGFARAYWGVSNVALSFNEFQEMLDAAREQVGEGDDSDLALIDVNASFLTNSPAEGEAIAKALVAEYPQSTRAWILLAGMQTANNENPGARASYEAALEIDPQSPGALMGLASNYLFNEPKDFGRAETVIARFNATYPNEARGFEMLGDINRAQGDLEGALAAYQRAADVDPTLELALHKQGHINSFLGNIDDARASYDAAIEVAPPESKAGYAVYKCFTRIHEGDVSAAIDELQALANNVAAMGTPPDQVKGLQVFALTSAAQAALDAGMYERALAIIERRDFLNMQIAEDVGTEDAERLQRANNLMWDGLLEAYQGDVEGAEERASQIAAIVANDNNPRKMEPVHWVLGMAALQSGDFDGAVEELRQADHANNMYIRFKLAQALEGAGETDEAMTLYQQVADFNFNSVGFALVGDEAKAKVSGG